MLKLLLLSDIHFLSLHKEMDPNTDLRNAFLKDLAYYREVHGEINHILVCGDIAFKGEKSEYDAAHAFLMELCDVIGCKQEEIYVVPGNHDKNFYTANAELRHLIHAGLSNENTNNNNLFIDLLNNEFAQFKSLYTPFKDYYNFALKMVSTEPLMTKCLEEKDTLPYDNNKDKAYIMSQLGELNGYPVMLYGMNTSLCSDWHDRNDFGKGHKLFLPKLSYNVCGNKTGCINIVMMHHPTSRLACGEEIAKVLDDKFHIQIFGHLHQPASYTNEVIHIHSGALQPTSSESDSSDGYFSVYNILEMRVSNKNGVDYLNIHLGVEQFDAEAKTFKKMQDESKDFVIALQKNVNRWNKDECELQPKEALPQDITERTIKYRFLQLDNPKEIMLQMDYSYDEEKSHNKNCILFLQKIQSEQRMLELWNVINQK